MKYSQLVPKLIEVITENKTWLFIMRFASYCLEFDRISFRLRCELLY
jgi:hypothetical protein